jgi:transposase
MQQSRLLRRFEIALLIQAGVKADSVMWFFGCSLTMIRRWGGSTESTQFLDAKRSGRPLLFTESVRLRLIAFYCQCPLPGCRSWSVRWAAQYFSEHNEIIGRKISPSTIHRLISTHSLRPHRVRYFLHITDPLFFPKMERLLQLYREPPQHLFCFDECSGIQALERIGVEMVTDHGVKIEFEYIRHGTRDFYSIMEVGSGKVFGRATENHRQETLVDIFTEHVNSQPKDGVLHYICDNLAGHSTELFCRTVAQLSSVSYPPLKNAQQRRQWLESAEKRIIFHFTPYHGSWLNQVEIWFGIMRMKCLKGRSFTSAEELASAITAFCSTWTEYFAHPFRWTYTGEGLAEKVICRFTQWLILRHNHLKCEFLYKQLLLISNLAADYWPEVSPQKWLDLYKSLVDGHDYLEQMIDGCPNTKQVLAALLESLSAKLQG